MILPIVGYGDPILKKKAQIVEKNYPDLKSLISDMFETMYHAVSYTHLRAHETV